MGIWPSRSLFVALLLLERSESSRFFVVAGLEGTGHHFWNEVDKSLGPPLSLGDQKLKRHMQLCWMQLGEARRPNACAAREFPSTREAAIFVAGCSFPCGSPKPQDRFAHTSPDLEQLKVEGLKVGAELLVVAMVRDPVATVASSYSRRHRMESTFRSNAFDLYLNLGLLDHQLREVGNYVLVHYEDLVVAKEPRTLETLAKFLHTPVLHLTAAVAKASPSSSSRGGAGVDDRDRRYVEYLFFRPHAKTFLPVFWPALQRYNATRRHHR